MALRLAQLLQKPWVRKILVFTGVVVALFVIVNSLVLPWYVNHEGRLAVPNVTGMPLADAQAVLTGAGLQPIQAETRADPDEPVGTVVFQNPSAQSVVKQGRRVYLTVSGGEIQVAVPPLRGRSLREAKFALERFGLKLGSITFTPSDQYPENTILAQSAPPDSKLGRGSRVGITVSSGSGSDRTIVPAVIGKTVTEAEKILQSSGLNVGNISYQGSHELIPNTVVEQFPRAGETVASGQRIDLFVVKAGKVTEEIQPPIH